LAALRAGAGGRAAWSLTQWAATVFSCATLASCVANTSSHTQAVQTKYEFRLVSDALKDEWASERMFWVDNDRLVFRADVYEGWTRLEGKRYGLYLWNDRTRSLRQIEGVAVGLCATQGMLSFIGVRDDQRVYVEGPLDAITETLVPPGERDPDRLACRAIPPERVPTTLDPLLAGGYLEDRRFAPGGPHPYRFYPSAEATPVELPLDPTTTGTDVHRFSEYTRSYIFHSRVFDRERGVTPFLQVFVDGRTELHSLPGGAGLGSALVPLPTAQGWLVATPMNGIFLMRGNQVFRIGAGGVRDFAVSPNGCRAAFKTSLQGAAFARPHPVYTVNLCD
jgi:hypothetical protein